MKFAYKLVLALFTILALSFSFICYFSVADNFDVSLENTVNEHTRQHLFERYSLETELLELQKSYKNDVDIPLQRKAQALTDYLGADSGWQALYDNEEKKIYSTLPGEIDKFYKDAGFNKEESGYILLNKNEKYYIIYSSPVNSGTKSFYLASAYDITAVYNEQNRQLSYMQRMSLIVLLVAVIAVMVISFSLTQPIRSLNLASKKIAHGTYGARADIISKDEIGELAKNFNEMAEAVENNVDKLNLSVRQREDFVSAFTHEVKTPMTAIIGYSDMLRFQETSPEIRQDALGFIYREASRLEALSQKLLILMGMSSERLDIKPMKLDVLFRGAVHSVYPELEKNGVRVRAQSGSDIDLLADYDLVVDLLRNLLLNAINAQPEDKTVYLLWKNEGAKTKITVKDNGRGMAPDELDRITEPFYMGDKSRARTQGSSGIGLALCQKIAVLHSEKLYFESELGKGMSVSFYLHHISDNQ